MSVPASRRVPGLVHEHLSTIDAVKRSDGRRAERMTARHIRRIREAIVRQLG